MLLEELGLTKNGIFRLIHYPWYDIDDVFTTEISSKNGLTKNGVFRLIHYLWYDMDDVCATEISSKNFIRDS